MEVRAIVNSLLQVSESGPGFGGGGEDTDPFALQYAAGHDNIKNDDAFTHPRANAVQTLFAQLAAPGSGKLLSKGTVQR